MSEHSRTFQDLLGQRTYEGDIHDSDAGIHKSITTPTKLWEATRFPICKKISTPLPPALSLPWAFQTLLNICRSLAQVQWQKAQIYDTRFSSQASCETQIYAPSLLRAQGYHVNFAKQLNFWTNTPCIMGRLMSSSLGIAPCVTWAMEEISSVIPVISSALQLHCPRYSLAWNLCHQFAAKCKASEDHQGPHLELDTLNL